MTDKKLMEHECDLCGLEVGIKPYYLESAEGQLQFCCDGCLGIYQILHETTDTAVTPDDTQPSKGEIP
jgi:hypothetical protein